MIMEGKLRRGVCLASIGAAVAAIGGCSCPPPPQAPTMAEWDAAAANEAKAQILDMFKRIDSGDTAGIEASLTEEGWVASYDHDGQGKPISYRSKKEAVELLKAMLEEAKKAGVKMSSNVKSHDCRATATVALCALEFDQSATTADAPASTMSFRATAGLRKGKDGWKWNMWHASFAKLPEPPPPPPPLTPSLEATAVDGKSLVYMEMEGGGPKVAPIWKGGASPVTAALVKSPSKTKSQLHAHSVNAWIFVRSGTFSITTKDGKKYEAKSGGFVLQPARVPHVTECPDGCEIIMVTDGLMDIALVDEAGNIGPYLPMKLVEAKKDEPKKDEPKKLEPKKLEPKKLEPKKLEPKKLEPNKDEPGKSKIEF
jgi:mannose-6-phosphate isomerase-like protein (cupin superfamily)